MKTLLDLIPMKPATRAAYEAMPSPQRAWAIAKATFETAQEANFAEQRAASKSATADDPEPPFDNLPKDFTRAQRLAAFETWKAWSYRNGERIEAATKPIVARYPNELKKLAQLAEQNMVQWAREQMLSAMGAERFAQVGGAWTAYENNELFGEMRERILTICFNMS